MESEKEKLLVYKNDKILLDGVDLAKLTNMYFLTQYDFLLLMRMYFRNSVKSINKNKVNENSDYIINVREKDIYDSSDLGTIYQRMQDFNPNYILYITDDRQSMRFEMIFRVCEMSGISHDTKLLHLPNGTINGLDGKPYKTRSGDTPKLSNLAP